MKLTYWKAENLDGRDCYSIRAKTRKDCEKARADSGCPQDFAEPVKVVVEYRDAFHLVSIMRGEGSNWY
jgi:hypothetical protein